MANQARSSAGDPRLESSSSPTGADIRIESAKPPPGSVSALRLTEEAVEAAKDGFVSAVTPNLPEIPSWVWFLGAAVSGSIAYGAWQLLKATAPILVPAALGVPPATLFAMQQIAAGRSDFPAGARVPATFPMTRGSAPPSTAVPTTTFGSPLGASLPSTDLASLIALLPALGAQASATASALSDIAARVRNTSSPSSSEAPTRKRAASGSNTAASADQTRVSGA